MMPFLSHDTAGTCLAKKWLQLIAREGNEASAKISPFVPIALLFWYRRRKGQGGRGRWECKKGCKSLIAGSPLDAHSYIPMCLPHLSARVMVAIMVAIMAEWFNFAKSNFMSTLACHNILEHRFGYSCFLLLFGCSFFFFCFY